MTLEKNIERIADALEAIARRAGAEAGSGKQDPAAVQEGAGEAQQSGQIPLQGGQQFGQVPLQGGQQFGQAPLQGGQQSGQVPLQGGPQFGQAPLQGSQPAGQIPPQNGWQQPAAQGGMPGSGQVPTTASARQYTFDQLAVATANLSAAGKDVFAIMGRFGAGMLMELPPEKYGEYAAALREAGAVI